MRVLTIFILTLSLLAQPAWAVVSVCEDMGNEQPVMMDHSDHGAMNHDMDHNEMMHGMDHSMSADNTAMMDCCADGSSNCEMSSCLTLTVALTSASSLPSLPVILINIEYAGDHTVHVAQSLYRPPIQS